MEINKVNRKKSKRMNIDVTPDFHQKILDETYITNETVTVYVTRVIRENLEKRDS